MGNDREISDETLRILIHATQNRFIIVAALKVVKKIAGRYNRQAAVAILGFRSSLRAFPTAIVPLMNRRRQQLSRWDHRYLWHPFTQMQEWVAEPPLIIERGQGSYLFDIDGRRYL